MNIIHYIIYLSYTGGMFMSDNEFEQDLKAIEESEKPDSLTMEIFRELKEQNKKFDNHIKEQHKMMKIQWVIITILFVVAIGVVAGLTVYHDYQWSQFDTISVDTKQGGNASYIGGNGDVNNYGEDSSPQEEVNKQEKIKGNND